MTTTGTSFVDVIRDGDSFHSSPDGDIRLVDVCAPQQGKSGYSTAKRQLESLILGKNVRLVLHGRDSHGRLLADVYVDATHVNEAQRHNGWRC